MRRFLFILACCLALTKVQAQKITHEYNNVTLSEALRQLNEQTEEYTISFLYNELEDFRITTSVHRKTVPDAIRQMIGFYPIRMTVEDREIVVECPQKTAPRYKGTIIDEQGQPIAYANIALLSPQDSTLITGGVSNESGYFAIPYEQEKVLARISYVGYKTIYKRCDQPEAGTIRLQPETFTIKGVVIKGEIPQYKMISGGMTVEVLNSILKDVGTADDVLSMLPRVQGSDGKFTVFAKGTPEIYINNKKVHDTKELKQLKSSDVKSVDIITTPGARYNAETRAVIRIKTIRPQGDGMSVKTYHRLLRDNKWNTYDDIDLKYRSNGLELFGSASINNSAYGEDNRIVQEFRFGDNTVNIDQSAPNNYWETEVTAKVGANYDLDTDNSFGFSYQVAKSLYEGGEGFFDQTIIRNGQLQGNIDQYMGVSESSGPAHTADVYYVGKIGKLGIDFNGSYIWRKNRRDMFVTERSEELSDLDLHTNHLTHSCLTAGKLVLFYPVWKGELSVGSEASRTQNHATYDSRENKMPVSDDDIRESNVAGFAEYQVQLGKWSFGGGLRYEHVKSDYRSFGIYQDDLSRTYNDLFPNVAIGWQQGKWGLQLGYNKRVSRPTYHQLDSNVQYDNRYMYEGGNPLLQPTKLHSLELVATYDWLNLSMGYTRRDDEAMWINRIYQAGQEIMFTTYENYDHHDSYNASFVASPKIGFWQPTLELTYFQQHFRDMNRPELSVNFRNWFIFDKTFKGMVYLHYASSHDYGFIRDAGQFNVNLRLQKTFLKGSLTTAIYANDIFRTLRSKFTGYWDVATLHKDAYIHTQCIGVFVNYTFNSTRSKYRGTGAGNAEKNRL